MCVRGCVCLCTCVHVCVGSDEKDIKGGVAGCLFMQLVGFHCALRPLFEC